MKHVLYHDNCSDGFTAAWLFAKAFGTECKFYPMNYGNPFPDIKDKGEIYMVDFNMEIPDHITNSVAVLDHHIGAQKLFESQYGRIDPFSCFDTKYSGCQLVYQKLKNYIPFDCGLFVNYVGDRDLWKWRLPFSVEINAYIVNQPKTFESWDLMAYDFEKSILDYRTLGAEILACEDKIIKRAKCHVSGDITFVNSHCFQSEIGNLHGPGPVVIWYFDGNQVCCSVRGNGALNIAKGWGGGGHELAAGFTTDITEFFTWMKNDPTA